MKTDNCHFLPSFCEFLPFSPPIGVNMAKSGLPTYETPLQKLLLKTRVFADALLPLFAEFLQPGRSHTNDVFTVSSASACRYRLGLSFRQRQ